MAGIGSPRQCRSGIDEADQPCHTGPAPVPRCARVGLDTGMNLAVRTGVGPVSSAVSCSRSSTASRFPRHPPGEPHIPGASALALRAPSDAPETGPHERSRSRRAEQQSRRTAVRRRHPMSDSDRHSHHLTNCTDSRSTALLSGQMDHRQAVPWVETFRDWAGAEQSAFSCAAGATLSHWRTNSENCSLAGWHGSRAEYHVHFLRGLGCWRKNL